MTTKVKAPKKQKKTSLTPFDPSEGVKSHKISLAQVARTVNRALLTTKPNSNVDYEQKLKFAWVPVEKMYLNYERQRWPEPAHISKVYNKWDLHCVTPLQARYSAREDRYYIADGQQHGIAWVLKYGTESNVPVFYIESEDEDIETKQLLALNTDSKPMAHYFIHKQKVKMKIKDAVDLELCVTDANCRTGYKKSSAGYITHIQNLEQAQREFGLDPLKIVLTKMRMYWPMERISTMAMLGFLEVHRLLNLEGIYTDELFDEIFNSVSEFYLDMDRIYKDIKAQFAVVYPRNHQGMGLKAKVASGIIDAYEKIERKPLITKPFDIDMPFIDQRDYEEEEDEVEEDTLPQV